MSLSALSLSVTHKVYKYLLHLRKEEACQLCDRPKNVCSANPYLTLNLVTSPVFFILTERASFLRAVNKKSLISWICFGYSNTMSVYVQVSQESLHSPQFLVLAIISFYNSDTRQKDALARMSVQLMVVSSSTRYRDVRFAKISPKDLSYPSP